MNRIEEFIKSLGIRYNDIKTYEAPFLHASYIHETPWDDVSYDRLEFFGDSILSFVVSEYLYNNYPEFEEGEMTLFKVFLVEKAALSKVGKKLNIQNYVFLGQGHDRESLSDSVFEDIIESLIAAIYLDAGFEEAKRFIYEHILIYAEGVDVTELKDPKSRLQELLQAETRKSVKYITDKGVRSEGNELIFTSKATFDDNIIGEGKGKSKKEAEKEAAKDAFDRMAE